MYSSSVHPLLLTQDLLEFTGYGPCGSLTSARYNSRSSGEHLGATIIVCLSAFLCLRASLPPCLFCLCASSPCASVPSPSCASVPSFVLCLRAPSSSAFKPLHLYSCPRKMSNQQNQQDPLPTLSSLMNLSQLPPLPSSHRSNNANSQAGSEPESGLSTISLTPPVPPSISLECAFQQIPPQPTSTWQRRSPPHAHQSTHVMYRAPLLRELWQPCHRHERSECNSHSSSREHSSPEHYFTRNSHSWRHEPRHDCNRTLMIKRETLAGLPSWPANLKLSLSTGNWLDWSRFLLRSLAMTQLDKYPLRLLQCPNKRTDPLGHCCWNGNDQMILGFMQTHMFSAEIQHVAACATSAEAFCMLRNRHEKRSGLTQLQLIQKLMQITFDDTPEHFETNMTTFRDLVYRIDSIRHVDINRLGLLFLLLNLKSSHPTVHDALAPVLMDGSISVELMETRMQFYFEMCGTQQGQQQHLPNTSIVLPAQLPPRTIICSNCKWPGHTIDFCIAPGRKMEGLSMQDAVNCQCIIRETQRQHVRPREEGNTLSNGTLLKLGDDSSVWIAGIRYRPDNKISTALADTEVLIFSPDLDEYPDWPADSSADTLLDTNTILIASIDYPNVALLSHPTDLPFFLDSGTSSHISCIRSDFTTLQKLNELRKISGVGNASVFAVGVSTIVLRLPLTNTQLQLHNVLFAPEACVCLISIHQLNKDCYVTVFQSSQCKLTDSTSTMLADCTPNSSNLYALPDTRAQVDANPIALPSLILSPNLETWH